MAIFDTNIFDLFTGRTRVSQILSTSTSIGTNSGEVLSVEELVNETTVVNCIDVIASGIAQLHAVVIDNNTSTALDQRIAVSRVLKRPNDYQTQYSFTYSIVSSLLSKGNAYIRIIRNPRTKEVMQMIPMDASRMTVNANAAGAPVYHNYDFGDMLAADVIHIKDINTDDPEGLSRVRLGRDRIGAMKAADSLIGRTFRDGISMDYVIMTDENLDAEKAQEYIEALKGSLGTRDGRNFTLMTGGGSVQSLKGMTPADAELRQIRQDLIKEIAALFKVPAYLVGGSGDQKYSNVRQQQASLYRDTYLPIITNIEQAMSLKLILRGDASVHFDVSDLLKGDVESTARVALQMVSGGIWTPNEGRSYTGKARMDEENHPEANELRVPGSVSVDDMRGSEDQPNAMNPEATEEGENDGQ